MRADSIIACLFCIVMFVVWFGLVCLNVDLGLAIAAWIVLAKKQMPELVHIISVFFTCFRDRNGPRGKPQVSGRDFNLSW